MAQLEAIRKEFEGFAEFVYVYIKEAHPEDEWQMESNERDQVLFKQPRTLEERLELARTFVRRMEVEGTTLVDDMQNTANACYAAWPERIYVIDRNGIIVYKGGMGPFYFKPAELQEFLRGMRNASPASESAPNPEGLREG